MLSRSLRLFLAGLPWKLPEVIFGPFSMIGAAAAPLALLTFGMSIAIPRTEGETTRPPPARRAPAGGGRAARATDVRYVNRHSAHRGRDHPAPRARARRGAADRRQPVARFPSRARTGPGPQRPAGRRRDGSTAHGPERARVRDPVRARSGAGPRCRSGDDNPGGAGTTGHRGDARLTSPPRPRDRNRARLFRMTELSSIEMTPQHPLDDTTTSAGASEKTLLVLEAALTHSRFTEVVEAAGLAKATTHRILGTLVDRQFITVDADGNYLPGPKILSLAGMALQRIDISAIARPFVDELVAKTHCTVHLGVVNGDEIIYLVRADSDRPYVIGHHVGLAIPMHCTGIGKVVLGSRADEELK